MMDAIKAKIGKDVIESLTLGMYEDSRFIFREYVQNAADQIDIAVEEGILESRENAYIDIEINKHESEISIKDNATGIRSDKVEEVLKNIAFSPKDRSKHKGFRGIGRLGGLGYCESLIFETSFKGENIKSNLTWDAKKLKEIIHNRTKKEEASEVIDNVTDARISEESLNEHYFKVILRGVENNTLLDKKDIRDYLSMVAPVPYDKGFLFTSQIKDELRKIGKTIDEYKIFINSDQLFKPYTNRIYEGEPGNKKTIDEIKELQYFSITLPDNDIVIAWGWYGITNFSKQIPRKANPDRGIRLRKGNIQIGSEYCLVKLFKEQRGNFYFVGEIHAFHHDLIPNARRDYFVENNTLRFFENKLRELFHTKLDKLYRFASQVRNTTKKIVELQTFKDEYQVKKQKGFSDKQEEKKYTEKFEHKKESAEKAEKELYKMKEKIEPDSPERKIYQNIIESLPNIDVTNIQIDDGTNGSDTKFLTDDLTQLNRKERKLISRIFTIIDRVLTPDLSENLKEKIREEFK